MAEEWRAVAERVRNWGRWGADDQLGTLNYITPAKVAEAAALVRDGRVIPLGIPLDAYGPWTSGYRRNPLHLMTVVGTDERTAEHLAGWGGATEERLVHHLGSGPARFNDDFITLHLQAGTQWDALAHIYYDDRLYNDVPAAAVTALGATRCAIDVVAAAGQVVSRGVLLDVARHRGVPYLPSDAIIGPEELEEVASEAGVEVGSGDVVVVRTGWWARFVETRDAEDWRRAWPGLSWRCAEWLHEREVAAVAADNIGVETSTRETGFWNVFHMLALRDMGMPLGEIWDLEELGADCARDGRAAFQLVAQPLQVTGAVGSPVHPLAIK